ncbi:MAG TPA: peptidylprolyl isomerase [Actinomycetota bacterium]|nr:peptidylprolyl isomerase [Actinomycetota bacterium]
MPNRSRDKQLAKLAARRQAERQAARRRRDLTLGVIGGIAGLVLLVVGYAILTGDEEQPAASASPSVSASAEPTGEPGTRSGSVTPVVEPASTVACGGEAPPGAGGKSPQFVGPPPMTIDERATYTARVATSCGMFDVELRPDIAPEAVNSFVFLAERGFYDGLTFHRIVEDFVIQGGDPLGDGSGGPGYSFDIETSPKQTFDAPGLLAYANSGPGSNGSQFFVTLAPTPQLDPGAGSGEYTIFGEVTDGLDVVRRIDSIPGTENPGIPGELSVPTEAVYIDSITIDERPA